MSKLKDLEEKQQIALNQIESLKARKVKAERAVYDNPANEEAAMKVGALELQIKAAEAAGKQAAEAIVAEKARLESKEYKDAQKKLQELEKQAQDIQESQKKWVIQFFPIYEEWLALVQEHERWPGSSASRRST